MATAKKTTLATTAPVSKKTAKVTTAAAPSKAPAKAPAKKAAAKTVVKTPAVKTPAVKTVTALKPIKTAFSKTALSAYLAEQSGVEPKATKAVLAALEATILASVNKKGLGAFTLPGLLKITAQNVPAKKKRLGKDPFTGQERMFAAKPASTKIKARAMKKLKDAAL